MLKSLLPISLCLLVTQAFTHNLLAQTDSNNRQQSKVTIRSYTQQGNSTVESTVERLLGSDEDMGKIMDSILQNLGMRVEKLSSMDFLGDSMHVILKNLNPRFDTTFSLFKDFNIDDLQLPFNLEEFNVEGNFVLPEGIFLKEKPSAFLGIVFEDVINDNEEITSKRGITVTRISEGSAAQDAGLSANDIILIVDDIEIDAIPTLQKIISSKSPGDKITIIYERDGRVGETIATLKPRKPRTEMWSTPEPNAEELQALGLPKCDKIIVQKSGPKLGLSVTDPNPEARKALKVKSGGALITKVEQNSCAHGMHLQVNDVILSLNKQKVQSSNHLKEIVGSLPLGSEITIEFQRYGKRKTATGTLQQYSLAWEDHIPLNIIDFSTREFKIIEERLQEIEDSLEQMGRRAKRRN